MNYSKKNIELTRVEIGKAVKCFIDNGGVIEKIEYREPHFLWGNNPIREERLYPMAYSKSQ